MDMQSVAWYEIVEWRRSGEDQDSDCRKDEQNDAGADAPGTDRLRGRSLHAAVIRVAL